MFPLPHDLLVRVFLWMLGWTLEGWGRAWHWVVRACQRELEHFKVGGRPGEWALPVRGRVYLRVGLFAVERTKDFDWLLEMSDAE